MKPNTAADIAATLYPDSPAMQERYAQIQEKRMAPKQSILSPAFKYVNAASTDIAKTFANERKRIRERARIAAEARKIERDLMEGDTNAVIEIFAKRRDQ